MPDDGLDQLAGLGPECDCDYPHSHDFEPPFETCTCVPGCSHRVEDVTQEDADIGEECLCV
jgi:hypothetical protein